MKCRHCSAALDLRFIDLGSAPPSNAYLSRLSLHAAEKWYPLRVLVCRNCWLVQTQDFAAASEMFDADYAYFSGYSRSWIEHCERYTEQMIATYELDQRHLVVEVAANDGCLLQCFRERGIRCLGIEPTASTAEAARARGIEIVQDFFGSRLAKQLVREGITADVMAANNVLAHVPDINDFVAGFAELLAPQGVATFEFPHLLRLIEGNQFDTIYHEHFSYLSITAVDRILEANGMKIFDVEELPTHGGSLRVSCQRKDTGVRPRGLQVENLLALEQNAGLLTELYYATFQRTAEKVKNDFLSFLLDAKKSGAIVAGYGAAAKGNTLLNFAGVRPDLLAFVADRNPAKQERFLPGSRIEITTEDRLRERRPDYVVILPWNLREEVMIQLGYIREWGGKFVTAVPSLEVL